MTVFVDTTALYAILDRDDANHRPAAERWSQLLRQKALLRTHNYVLLETSALLQHRLGIGSVRTFSEDIVPLLDVEWISEQRHAAGIQAMLTAARRKLSIVDCVSFQMMRETGIKIAFCFDDHFREQGLSMPV